MKSLFMVVICCSCSQDKDFENLERSVFESKNVSNDWSRLIEIKIVSASVTSNDSRENHNAVSVFLPSDYVAIGGGAKISNVAGEGVMLKGSMQKDLPVYPNPTIWNMYPTNRWEAVARDHLYKSSATLTAYAIGIKKTIPIVGELQ